MCSRGRPLMKKSMFLCQKHKWTHFKTLPGSQDFYPDVDRKNLLVDAFYFLLLICSFFPIKRTFHGRGNMKTESCYFQRNLSFYNSPQPFRNAKTGYVRLVMGHMLSVYKVRLYSVLKFQLKRKLPLDF